MKKTSELHINGSGCFDEEEKEIMKRKFIDYDDGQEDYLYYVDPVITDFYQNNKKLKLDYDGIKYGAIFIEDGFSMGELTDQGIIHLLKLNNYISQNTPDDYDLLSEDQIEEIEVEGHVFFKDMANAYLKHLDNFYEDIVEAVSSDYFYEDDDEIEDIEDCIYDVISRYKLPHCMGIDIIYDVDPDINCLNLICKANADAVEELYRERGWNIDDYEDKEFALKALLDTILEEFEKEMNV